MLRSLTSGVSGIQQFQEQLDVIGNNIANSNTYGFKAARADFADSFSDTVGSAANGSIAQVGSGVTTGTIRSLFEQNGTVTPTGGKTDMAIQGEGFFTVRDPVSDQEYATRAGNFHVDTQGYLVSAEGFRVQGYSDGGLGTRGDLMINDDGKPTAGTFDDFSIDSNGVIKVSLTDATSFTRGQVLLQRFQDPNALVKEGNNLYSGLAEAGALGGSSPAAEAPGTNGLGSIKAGSLESSAVDLSNEFASMIVTQRGFQAAARIITTSDEILQEVVNLKR
jgi:flagellar hook protein FlgE